MEYSAIDFSRWSRKSPAGAKDKPEATETEYAELQKEGTAEGLGDTAEEVEVEVEEEMEMEMEVEVEVEEKQEAEAEAGIEEEK